jgi:ubiquinone/menaquinone biosynthesis C-methylase UbiE
MTYILESNDETERLKFQNSLPQYNVEKELSFLNLELHGKKVLDAGCGVGTLSHWLASRYQCMIEACDFSEQRIREAKLKSNPNSKFSVQDLTRLEFSENTFDCIFTRFVLEHTNDPYPILRELRRVLKKNGELIIIDFDGLIFNLYHRSLKLKSFIDKLIEKLPIDLFIGRKLPRMLSEEGFELSDCHIQPLVFEKQELEVEIKNMEMRFLQTQKIITSIIGDDNFTDFVNLYTTEMRKSQIHFCNKFILRVKKIDP